MRDPYEITSMLIKERIFYNELKVKSMFVLEHDLLHTVSFLEDGHYTKLLTMGK